MKLNLAHYSKFKTTKANNSAWLGFSPLSWFNWIKSNAGLKFENINISDLPSSKVSRKELFDMAKNPDIDTLICCISILAWGGMNRKHGLSLIENYAEWIHVAENIRQGTLSREDAYDAFSALRKESKLPGMGPAYFTKLIFFLASQDKQVGYIMDQWTATSANLLFDEKVVITQLQKSESKHGKSKLIEVVTDKNTKHNYDKFCKCVELIAADLSFTPSLVEEMMFSEGRKKGEWRNYLVEQRSRQTVT